MTLKEFFNFILIDSEHLRISVTSILVSLIGFFSTVVFLKLIKGIFQRFIDKKKLDERASWSILRINVGVSCGSVVIGGYDSLIGCAQSHVQVSNTPAPFVRVNDFGESSLDFKFFFSRNFIYG